MPKPVINLGHTVCEAAEALGVHPEHVRRLIRTRRLVARKIGRRYHIQTASLAAYAQGPGDDQHRHLAARWTALVGDRSLEPELRQLLTDTFSLSAHETDELMGAWRHRS